MRKLVGDLETDGLYWDVTQVWCGVFTDIDTEETFSFHPGSHVDYIAAMLSFLDESSLLLFHNGFGFDFRVLEKLYGYEYKGYKMDTLIISRMLYPNIWLPPHAPKHLYGKLHSIEAWGWRVGLGKQEHEDWSRYSPEMLSRCKSDVAINLRVWQRMKKKIDEDGWTQAVMTNMRLFDILAKQEIEGWRLDIVQAKKCLHFLTNWMCRIDDVIEPHLPFICIKQETKNATKDRAEKGEYKYASQISTKAGKPHANLIKWCVATGWVLPDAVLGPFSRVDFRRIRLSSREETIKYLLSEGWIPAEWNENDDGEPTSPILTYRDPFDGITTKEGLLAAKRVQCRHRHSLVKGLFKHLRPDGKLPSRVAGLADTGRMRHAIIVNIPNPSSFFGKWLRKMFVADEGKVLVGTDAMSCQARMMAGRVKNDEYTHMLLNGKKEDETTVHHNNAKSVSEATGLYTSYGQAKTLQYAWLFGAGDTKLGSTLGGGGSLGEVIRAALVAAAPGLDKVMAALTAEWKATARSRPSKRFRGAVEHYNGTIRGLDGRPIRIPSEHALLVYVLQSDEAILMALAVVLQYDELHKRGLKWGREWVMVSYYHDETTIMCDPEVAEEVGQVQAWAIEEAGKLLGCGCPHGGDTEQGVNWYDIHTPWWVMVFAVGAVWLSCMVSGLQL